MAANNYKAADAHTQPLPQPPYVVLYSDRVEICERNQAKLTITASVAPESLPTYAKTYADLLHVTLVDRTGNK